MYILFLVLDDPNKLDAVLDAWHDIGVSGVTIMESSSRHRRQQVRPLGARYLFGAARAVEHVEKGQFTLMTVVPTLEAMQQCESAAEQVMGDLSNPETGILAAWQLDHVKGVPPELRRHNDEGAEG